VRAIEQLYADALPGHLAELARARRPGEPIGDDGSSTALRRQVAQQVRHGAASGYHSGAGASMIGRTSMGVPVGLPPGPGAAEVRAAISMARCSLSTSTIQNPARYSLASGKARR